MSDAKNQAPSDVSRHFDNGNGAKSGETGQRAQAMQAKLATREAKPKVMGAAGLFSAYKPSGTVVKLSEVKIGIMPDLPGCIQDIAADAGVNLADAEAMSLFLEALVADVYTNPYSDKMDFSGHASLGESADYQLPRSSIKRVLTSRVGTANRRFARAMAPLVVEVMSGNPQFNELLDRRCTELNLSTREEAVRQFDGNEGLACLDRAAAQRAAEAKALALSMRSSHRAYGMDNSAKAMGLHDGSVVSEHERA